MFCSVQCDELGEDDKWNELRCIKVRELPASQRIVVIVAVVAMGS